MWRDETARFRATPWKFDQTELKYSDNFFKSWNKNSFLALILQFPIQQKFKATVLLQSPGI